MQRLKRDLGTIYSEEEARVLGPLQRLRQWLLAPISAILARLGIRPDMLSYASVGLAAGFCLLSQIRFAVAFWLLVAAFLCDGLDGVLARLIEKDNARGSFTDMFCDQAVVALSVAGLAWRGTMHPALAVLFVFLYTAFGIFLALHFLLQVSTRGIVRPGKTLFGVAIGLDFFFHTALLNYLALAYLLTLPLLGLSFWRLRKAL